MRMAVEGISCIGSFGFGLGDLSRALVSPPAVDASGPMPLLPKADTGLLGTFMSPRAMRQMDHFTRMALVCAYAALEDAGLTTEDMRYAGIVLASGYGPCAPTFAFLDSIEDYGAQMASPLAFSHSVHNIPAANIALKLGMAGPCATFCQLESSVAAGLLTAASWLAEGRVSRVLFGAVDEYTPILAFAIAQMIGEKKKNVPARRDLPLGEGAAFFCLCAEPGRAPRANIIDVALEASTGPEGYMDFIRARYAALPLAPSNALLCSGSFSGLERRRQEESLERGRAYGNFPVAQAFDMLVPLAQGIGPVKAHSTICASSSPAGAFSAVTVALPGI